jgi:flagellar biosynthesis regulator FlaF
LDAPQQSLFPAAACDHGKRSRQAITASDHGKRSWQAIMASEMASLGNALPTTESLA